MLTKSLFLSPSNERYGSVDGLPDSPADVNDEFLKTERGRLYIKTLTSLLIESVSFLLVFELDHLVMT